jgi:hypothetical protein
MDLNIIILLLIILIIYLWRHCNNLSAENKERKAILEDRAIDIAVNTVLKQNGYNVQ